MIHRQCRLIEPTVELERSHEAFVHEFRARGEDIVPWVAEEPYRTFAEYVAMLLRAPQGIDSPLGFVPHSTYWLLDAAGEIVAISNLRHELTNDLLRYGGHIGYGVRPSAGRQGYATELLGRTLVKAKRLGIARARLTCDKDNTGSEKTILRNGGRLDEEEFMPEHGCVVSRYWINL